VHSSRAVALRERLTMARSVDGLDNQKQLVSPDTGPTARTFTHDASGNVTNISERSLDGMK
jgi:uncharacterized protein RhaS with RHS repeats